MTKSEFFALLTANKGRAMEVRISSKNEYVFLSVWAAPNAGLSNHRTAEACEASRAKFARWMAEWEETQVVAAVEAAPVEPFEVTIKGSVGVDNLFHKGDVIYAGSIEGMKATVTKLPKVGDIVTATDWRGEVHSRVKVRQVLNDMPPRPAHLQACMDAHHDELFSGFFNDRAKPTTERKHELEDMTHDQIYIAFAPAPADVIVPDCVYTPDPSLTNQKSIKRTYTRRKTIVQKVGEANGVKTYRIRLDNGRVYLFTEGERYAQIKMPGGSYKDTTSAYTLSRLRQAISQA